MCHGSAFQCWGGWAILELPPEASFWEWKFPLVHLGTSLILTGVLNNGRWISMMISPNFSLPRRLSAWADCDIKGVQWLPVTFCSSLYFWVIAKDIRECRAALHQKYDAISNFSTILGLLIPWQWNKAVKKNTILKRRQKVPLFTFDTLV